MCFVCVSGEYLDESEAWYRVVSPDGVDLLEGPDLEGERKLEMFLPGKVQSIPSFLILFGHTTYDAFYI